MNIQLKNINKSYDNKQVLENLSLTFTSGICYCITAPSGTGKTTLFRLLLGLEKPDSGIIQLSEDTTRFGVVFQEDRLCEDLDAVSNVMLVSGKSLSRDAVVKELRRLLPDDSLEQPVSQFSGGMKRKTAICRALLAESNAVIMDEPFTGLDETSKNNAIDMIKEKTKNKVLIFSSHNPEDLKNLDAVRIQLDNSSPIS